MDQILLTGYKVWAVSEARPKYSSFHVKVSLNARKGNLKEHVCIVQRAVLGTQGWTRSTLQSCTPAYSRASLWHQFLRDTAAPNQQHTHGLTRWPWSLHPRWQHPISCKLLCLLPASPSYYHSLHGMMCPTSPESHLLLFQITGLA